MHRYLELGFNAVWDSFPVELHYDHTEYEDFTCPHVTEQNRVPRVIVARNEAGYCSTGVCLDCLLAALRKAGEPL